MRRFHLVLVAGLSALLPAAAEATYPCGAEEYREVWKQEFARSGLHPAYEPWLLGQITQESCWRRDAVSPVGAEGQAQFMPATTRLMERAYGDDLRGLGGPRETRWALRAFFLLMREGIMRWRRAPERDDRYAWAAADYNGGPRWLRREKAIRDAWERDYETCRAAGRSPGACRENLEYADHARRYARRFVGF